MSDFLLNFVMGMLIALSVFILGPIVVSGWGILLEESLQLWKEILNVG
jgi:hypothetical protein